MKHRAASLQQLSSCLSFQVIPLPELPRDTLSTAVHSCSEEDFDDMKHRVATLRHLSSRQSLQGVPLTELSRDTLLRTAVHSCSEEDFGLPPVV